MFQNIISRKYLKTYLPQIFAVLCFGLGIMLWNLNPQKITNIPILKIEPSYPVDYSNDRILVGASHNVFVGKIIERKGNKERGIGPETQYIVQVVENIKGNLK